MIRTLEAAGVFGLLLGTAAASGQMGARPLVSGLTVLAVLGTFVHMQLAEEARPVSARRRLRLAVFIKETAWILVFALTGLYPALVGCFLLISYPLWRAK